jgi:BASS family bile acid:Na+ symporter
LVANFVLVPLLAVGIERVVPLDAPLALGLFLLAGSAGAPFLIKLVSAAKNDVAVSAALLVLLVPATVVFLPFYVPLATAHPSLRGLSYVPSSVLAIGLPLLSTLFVPILVGLAVKAVSPRSAARLVPIAGRLATIALVVVVVSTFGAHFRGLTRGVITSALGAGVLLTLGAFLVGYLLSPPERGALLGLGTAQRNIAGAMVIASRDFSDRDILVMVTVCAMSGLLVLFALAWLVGRHAPHVGPPIDEPARVPIRA